MGSHTRFVVQTSDVLADLRVNVLAEGSDKVIFFKERFLEDDEIVEHFIHEATRQLCWTMHRPRNGWYIRIRAPSFPRGAFIPFTPAPAQPAQPQAASDTPTYPAGSLLFSSRTNAPVAASTADHTHSYPPTPTTAPGPALVVQPPTPNPTSDVSQSASQVAPPPPTQITQFVLSPYVADPRPPAQQSFFARAMSVIRAHGAAPSYSFTLSRVQPPPSPSVPPPYVAPPAAASTTALTSAAAASTNALPLSTAPVPMPTPAPRTLLTFTDHTPTLTYNTITGLIVFDEPELRRLGVETSFWIAVALTYLEFLQEKESYLAAMSD